jgi:DNA-binding response OmpR family regulator
MTMMMLPAHASSAPVPMGCLTVKQIVIDPERFYVMNNASKIVLTKTEFYILYLMISTKGKIHSRNDISRYVWGVESLGFPRTIDTHISNIRKKVGKIGNGDIITVVKGVGYKLNDQLVD